MKNLMIDLETMGTNPGSAIVAIGAVFFDETGLGPDFYATVSLQSCLDAGLRLDASTVMWWMSQSDEARKAITCTAMPLPHALIKLNAFLQARPPELSVWGNGASFDNVLLRDAYKAVSIQEPWVFYEDRCYRTLKALRPDVPLVRNGTHHNALDDARSQATHAREILYKMAFSG